MKVSDEESLLLTGMDTYEQAADKLLQMGPSLVAVTLGGDGVLIATKEKKEKVPGYRVIPAIPRKEEVEEFYLTH